MKIILKNKMYNTETATHLGTSGNILPKSDFNWFTEKLYKKRTGEYFLFGEGGGLSPYCQQIGNGWTNGWRIIPLDEKAARHWVEANLDVDAYIEIFGEPEE